MIYKEWKGNSFATTSPHGSLEGELLETVRHAVINYGYLLPTFGHFTYLELAHRIEDQCDLAVPRIAAICEALRKAHQIFWMGYNGAFGHPFSITPLENGRFVVEAGHYEGYGFRLYSPEWEFLATYDTLTDAKMAE